MNYDYCYFFFDNTNFHLNSHSTDFEKNCEEKSAGKRFHGTQIKFSETIGLMFHRNEQSVETDLK